MEISDYLHILKRSWVIIILAMTAGAIGGYWAYHMQTPMYRSSTQMVVSGSGNSPADEVASRLLASERALALSQVVTTPPALDAAEKAAGYPGAAVSVTSAANGTTPFLTVSVVGRSPAVARAVADGFTRTLTATIVSLEGPTESAIQVRRLAPASLPETPVSPNIMRVGGLGVAAGLVLGLVIAILRESLDRTVRDGTDVDELTALPILGTVPHDLPRNPLPATSKPRSARAEAYRQVRTTLVNARPRCRTLAVTSAAVGEGKTSIAANVAAAFSRAGHRVVVVDADLRRPCMATFFGLKPEYGLTDVLAGTCSLREALTSADDGGLTVLASGPRPANPSEALAGVAMKQVLRQLADEYSYIFVDTPPVLPVSDPLVLAPLVDGVILVIQLGRTTRDQIARATKALKRVNATVLGVVPNKSGKGRDRDYRYAYQYPHARTLRKQGSGTDISLPVSVENGGPRRQARASAGQVPGTWEADGPGQ